MPTLPAGVPVFYSDCWYDGSRTELPEGENNLTDPSNSFLFYGLSSIYNPDGMQITLYSDAVSETFTADNDCLADNILVKNITITKTLGM